MIEVVGALSSQQYSNNFFINVEGESWQSKVKRLRAKMRETKTTVIVLSALDDIACKQETLIMYCCILSAMHIHRHFSFDQS